MSQETPQDHISKKPVVCQIPSSDAVIIRQVTFVNHPAFEVMDESATKRKIIRQILAFMRFHLLGKEV